MFLDPSGHFKTVGVCIDAPAQLDIRRFFKSGEPCQAPWTNTKDVIITSL